MYAIQGIFINVLLFNVMLDTFFVLHCMKHIHGFFFIYKSFILYDIY